MQEIAIEIIEWVLIKADKFATGAAYGLGGFFGIIAAKAIIESM